MMAEIKSKIFQVFEDKDDVRLASAEIFLTYSENLQINSRGLEYQNNMTRIMLEAVIIAGSGENEVESSLIRNERFIDILDVDNLLSRYIKYAKENLIAKLPESGKYKVIFTEEALLDFFDYYKTQSSGGAVYNQFSKFKLQDELVKDAQGDKLNLSYDPTLRGGLITKKYDSYGTLLTPFKFIIDGKLEKITCSKKYADYLNSPVTGGGSNLVVDSGSMSYNELLEDNTLILFRFSQFSPNDITGAFSGEIRNGLHYKNGEFTPIKGGSVSGMMDDAMKNVYFSSERVQEGAYCGPQYVKVNDIDIAG